jgi:hypothetical protein
VGTFLDTKTDALVPPTVNPNSNLISLAYSSESPIILVSSERVVVEKQGVRLFHCSGRAAPGFVTILNVHLFLQMSAPQNDYTFATLKEFSDFSSNVLNIGVAGLEGCTVLTVVSPEAVYMVSSHRNRNHET